MSNFILTAESGVSVNATSKTLEGAKREATAWMTHGGKGVTVCDQKGYPICAREFWENGRNFGWEKWKAAS